MSGDGIRIDPHDFGRILRHAKDFDRKLATSVRRELRLSAAPILADVKSTLARPTPNGRGAPPRRASVRAGLAAGTKVAVNTGEKRPGIRITTSSAKLPPNKKIMLRLYNKETWRHPVFGDGARKIKAGRGALGALKAAGDAAHNKRAASKWVTQRGRPYFGSVIVKHHDEARAAVVKALEEAVEAMEGTR